MEAVPLVQALLVISVIILHILNPNHVKNVMVVIMAVQAVTVKAIAIMEIATLVLSVKVVMEDVKGLV